MTISEQPRVTFSHIGQTVLNRRYLAKDKDGDIIETPDELFRRVSWEIASQEKTADDRLLWHDQFYNLLSSLDFLPNSPCLANAGRDNNLGYLACFVIPVPDDIDGIYEAIKVQAKVHQSGGGCVQAGTPVYINKLGMTQIDSLNSELSLNEDESLDVSNLGLQTLSFDQNGKPVLAKITNYWKFNVPLEKQRQIRLGNSSFVTTSEWHPFMVKNKNNIEFIRADELKIGMDVVFPFMETSASPDYDELEWLFGFYVADGSMDFTKNGFRVRFSKGDKLPLERAKKIIKDNFGNEVNIYKDPRQNSFELCVIGKDDSKGFIGWLRNKGVNPGKKSYSLTPVVNIRSFIAGLFDGDCYIGGGTKSSFSTINHELAVWVSEALSCLGIRSHMRARNRTRLKIGIDFEITFGSSHLERLPLSRETKFNLIRNVRPRQPNKVLSIETPLNGTTDFYDFTVEGTNTYDAGHNSMVAIHNTGFSFSSLRPTGDYVGSSGGVASGPVSFMKIFNASTEEIKQGGFRRGANMGILHLSHPDVMKFITCKSDMKAFGNFNISVAVPDSFFEKVQNGGMWQFKNPKNGEITGEMPARDIFDTISENAWNNGDPGLFFIDRANATNPVPSLQINATNPCGEIPLPDWASCNLGSINLINHYINDGITHGVDWTKLTKTIKTAVRFLDNVIDASPYADERIETMAKNLRKVGLGVMGWGDFLFRIGIPYNTKEAVDLGESIMEFIQTTAREESYQLACEKGTFDYWDISVFALSKRLERNSTVTMIAPTGTISMIAGVSGGIEPVFSLVYKRMHYLGDDPNTPFEMVDVNPVFEQYMTNRLTEELKQYLLEGNALKDWEGITEEEAKRFVTSHEVEPEWHVRMQSAFQKYCDDGVSKTINFPKEATVDDIKRSYMLAYELGIPKGITVYREGSREWSVMSHEKKEEKTEEAVTKREKLPSVRDSVTHKFVINGEDGYMTIGKYPDGRFGEMFVTISKEGSTIRGLWDTIGVLTSLLLQHGCTTEELLEKFSGVSFPPYGRTDNKEIPITTSMVDYVYRFMATQAGINGHTNGVKSGMVCSDCFSQLIYAEGCYTCFNCGNSKCG